MVGPGVVGFDRRDCGRQLEVLIDTRLRLGSASSDMCPSSISTLAGRGRLSSTGYTKEMARTEHSINDALAELLRGTRRAWRNEKIVTSEDTGQLKDTSGRPDILVIEPNVSPVVIETEVFPATTVEAEALSRLGVQMRTTGRKILSSVAVRLPDRLRTKYGDDLKRDLTSAVDLEMALYTGSSASAATRWPSSGWMVGTVAELSTLTQAASVPPDVIDAAVSNLVNGVGEAAGILSEIANSLWCKSDV